MLTIESMGLGALCCVWFLLSSYSPKQQLEQHSSQMLLPLLARQLQLPHQSWHQSLLLPLCQLLSLHHQHQTQLLVNLLLWVLLKKRSQQKNHQRHQLLSAHHQLTGMSETPKIASLSISLLLVFILSWIFHYSVSPIIFSVLRNFCSFLTVTSVSGSTIMLLIVRSAPPHLHLILWEVKSWD